MTCHIIVFLLIFGSIGLMMSTFNHVTAHFTLHLTLRRCLEIIAIVLIAQVFNSISKVLCGNRDILLYAKECIGEKEIS